MIRNRQILFIVVAMFTLGVVSVAQAGMVNYQRRKGVVTKAPAKKPYAAPVQAKVATTNNAMVATGGSIKVTNVAEKKFDTNGDGILQADEQKKTNDMCFNAHNRPLNRIDGERIGKY